MVTLIIPTINRSDFIIKYLYYLNIMKFDGQVLIGDSSDQYHFNLTKNYLNSSHFSFTYEHINYPNLLHFEVVRNLISYIKYDFVTYINDDDILVVDTLKKCIDFLEENKDYSAVGGFSVCLGFAKNEYERVDYDWHYKVKEIIQNSAIERFLYLMSEYSVVAFSLSRTSQFKKRWPVVDELNNKGFAIELLPCAITAIQGKIKMLDDLYVVRQIHDRRIILPEIFDQIIDPDFLSSFHYSTEYVADMISKTEKVDLKIAKEQSYNGWKMYCLNAINHSMQKKEGSLNLLKRIIAKFPRKNLTSKLNSKNSIHYKNFKPIYQVITSTREQLWQLTKERN